MEKMPLKFVGKTIYMSDLKEIVKYNCGGIIIPNNYQIATTQR